MPACFECVLCVDWLVLGEDFCEPRVSQAGPAMCADAVLFVQQKWRRHPLVSMSRHVYICEGQGERLQQGQQERRGLNQWSNSFQSTIEERGMWAQHITEDERCVDTCTELY